MKKLLLLGLTLLMSASVFAGRVQIGIVDGYPYYDHTENWNKQQIKDIFGLKIRIDTMETTQLGITRKKTERGYYMPRDHQVMPVTDLPFTH